MNAPTTKRIGTKRIARIAGVLFAASFLLLAVLPAAASAEQYPSYPSKPGNGTTVIYSCPAGSMPAGGSGATLVCASAGTVTVPVSPVAVTTYSCPAGSSADTGSGATLTCVGSDGAAVAAVAATSYSCPAGAFVTGGSGASLMCGKAEAASTPVAAISTTTCLPGYFPMSAAGEPLACVYVVKQALQPPATTATSTPPTTTTTTTVVTNGSAVAAVDYGFTNGVANTPAVGPAIALTGTNASELASAALALIVIGAVVMATRQRSSRR